MSVKNITTDAYRYGTVDEIEDTSVPRGAASRALNWLTMGDHIELRRGQRYLGTSSVVQGSGKASGIKKTVGVNGVEQLFGTAGKKLKYFDRTTEEWVECGTDMLGSDVVDSNGLAIEPITMEQYSGLAGDQMFLSSPRSGGLYKVMIANPGSYADQYDAAKNFKAHLRIETNRMLMWRRTADKTGLYGSKIDTQTYTTVSGEGLASVASGTLAFKGGGSKRTCFAVSITATGSGQVFTDNYDGTLTGSAGGTGTINYTTGAFTTDDTGAGTGSYQWEDSSVGGICDFTKASPRAAGEGFIFRQDDGGGEFSSVGMYNNVYYCMHVKKTWVLNLTSDDTAATNLPYRERVGIPNVRAQVETGDGIYYVDDNDKEQIRVRLLTYDTNGSAQVIPVPVSSKIDLSDYRFDQAAMFEWGDYVLLSCATRGNEQTINEETVSVNNRTLVYNKLWKAWDVLDYGVTAFDIYEGALVGADSLSNNFVEMFSGRDDFDSDPPVENYWESDLDDFDTDGIKKVKKFYLRGLIEREQKLKVSISIDGGPYVEVGYEEDPTTLEHTYAIEGAGDYVDLGQSVAVGAVTLGKKTLGGGSADVITAYPYERLFSIATDRFERIKYKVEAMGIGYVSVSTQKYWDIRFKGARGLPQYK